MKRLILFLSICSAVLAVGSSAASTFPVTLVSQTKTTITLGWTPQPGYGYLFSVDGKSVSATNDPNRSTAKFAKGATSYEVAVIMKGALGTYPPAPPPPPPPPPAAQCADTVDNDADGKIDMADPGCLSTADNDETDVAQPAPLTTGTHWAEPSDYSTLKSIGYQFAITNVAPGDTAGAKAKLDAAHAAGIKLIIGLYAFGGPEPYVYNSSNGTWTVTAAATQTIDYLESRSADIIAFFGFNEPYWVGADGHTDSCGVYSAASLRDFRNKIKAIWPGALIYHDIGWPSDWAPGGDLYNAYSCIGNKYADATGVADYVGIWDYPFTTSGYTKTSAVARLQKERDYVLSKMQPAKIIWLGQAHSIPAYGLAWPTNAQLSDWNATIRQMLPAGSLISWYVWRQSIYDDYLANHPEQWSLTV